MFGYETLEKADGYIQFIFTVVGVIWLVMCSTLLRYALLCHALLRHIILWLICCNVLCYTLLYFTLLYCDLFALLCHTLATALY